MNSSQDVLRGELLGTVLHIPFAFFAGPIISIFLLLLINGLLSVLHSHLHGSGSIYDPLFWMPSVFVGAIVNRSARHKWAFVAPAVITTVIVLLVMWRDVSLMRYSEHFLKLAQGHLWRYEFENIFSMTPHTAWDKGLEQLAVTFPFLNAIAYSIGASVGPRFRTVESVRSTAKT